jgi:hypothetical protein
VDEYEFLQDSSESDIPSSLEDILTPSSPSKGSKMISKLHVKQKDDTINFKRIIKDHFKQKQPKVFQTQSNYYKVGKVIGCGSFSKVNIGMHMLTKRLVALKSVNKARLTENK